MQVRLKYAAVAFSCDLILDDPTIQGVLFLWKKYRVAWAYFRLVTFAFGTDNFGRQTTIAVACLGFNRVSSFTF